LSEDAKRVVAQLRKLILVTHQNCRNGPRK